MIAAFAKPPPTFAASTLNSTNCVAQPAPSIRVNTSGLAQAQRQIAQNARPGGRRGTWPAPARRRAATGSTDDPMIVRVLDRLAAVGRDISFGARSNAKPHPHDAPQMNGLQLTPSDASSLPSVTATRRDRSASRSRRRSIAPSRLLRLARSIRSSRCHFCTLRAGRCAGWFRKFNSLRYADDGRLIAVVTARQISMRLPVQRAECCGSDPGFRIRNAERPDWHAIVRRAELAVSAPINPRDTHHQALKCYIQSCRPRLYLNGGLTVSVQQVVRDLELANLSTTALNSDLEEHRFSRVQAVWGAAPPTEAAKQWSTYPLSHPVVKAAMNLRATGDKERDAYDRLNAQMVEWGFNVPLTRVASLCCGAGSLERQLVEIALIERCVGYDLALGALDAARRRRKRRAFADCRMSSVILSTTVSARPVSTSFWRMTTFTMLNALKRFSMRSTMHSLRAEFSICTSLLAQTVFNGRIARSKK